MFVLAFEIIVWSVIQISFFFYYCTFLSPLHSDEVEKISQYMKIRLDFQVNRGRQNKSCNISVCVLQKFRENQFHEFFFFGSDRLLKYLDCKKKRKRKEKYLKSFWSYGRVSIRWHSRFLHHSMSNRSMHIRTFFAWLHIWILNGLEQCVHSWLKLELSARVTNRSIAIILWRYNIQKNYVVYY